MDLNGKVMTADLTESNAAEGRYAAPTTTTERLLCEVLANIIGVERVSVDSHFFDDLGADSMVMARFCARLRKQTDLPPVPIKQVYEHPTISGLATALTDTSPTTTERLLSEVLADIMSVERVSVDSHFFDDLGADSMVMARFCARLRKQTDLPPVPIKQVYEHPTISGLATALNGASPTRAPASDPSVAQVATPAPAQVAASVGTPGYILCGALQILSIFGYAYLLALALAQGSIWIFAGPSFINILIRSVVVGNGIILATCILPILVKWLLIGRWKRQQIPIWSLGYLRFWIVKTLVRLNPLALFAGSPIYILYLRALGAKIGKDVMILSPHMPVCTDLLTIGDNTVIRKDAIFNCYRAHAGLIQTGSVTLGRDAYVGEMTVLDIETSMGDGAQIGHSSSLDIGQSIPAGEHRHGSPAREQTDVDYRNVDPTNGSLMRKVVFSAVQLLNWFLLSSILFSALVTLGSVVAERSYFAVPEAPGFSQWVFYADALLISLAIFFGAILLRLIIVVSVPRLFNRAIKPGRVYPLYGYHYWLHRSIARLTNVKFFVQLFGDSSYIVNYLRWIGYDLSEGVVQTGSNFGTAVKHDNPFLVSIGRGTMIADGLSMINADYSNSSFRLSRVTIGANNFFGNFVAYPAQGKTGENCLLATKVMVPVDGDVREGVGLLGSPSFEIPRSVRRDSELAHPKSDEAFGRQLAAKNRHNIVTIGLFLLVEWFSFFGSILLAFSAAKLYPTAGVTVLGLAMLLNLLLMLLYRVLVERATILFQALQAQQCSIYEPYFWFHERYWKLSVRDPHLALFNGTPLKSLAWRLMGVQIGKRVFDDGSFICDRTLVAIGDDCTLNAGSLIQCHSQEDGGFKTDRITIGAGCTIGVGSLVHYGVTIGDGAQIASGTFLMKGEEVPPHTRWGDNPAMEVKDNDAAGAAMTTLGQPGLGGKPDSENYKIPIKQAA